MIILQALVHLLRSQNVDLKNEPIPPVDTSKKPKGYVAKKPEQDEDWIKYRSISNNNMFIYYFYHFIFYLKI